MGFPKRSLIPLCTACLVSTLMLVPAAQAQEHRGPGRAQHVEQRRDVRPEQRDVRQDRRDFRRTEDRHDRDGQRRDWERREAERRREHDWRRDAERRREFEHRAAAWRFEHRRGWRFERHPGIWSPFYAWWWVGGRTVMLEAPTVTVVNYPTGRYELRGDGVNVPYYWAWVPFYTYAAAPPLPAFPAAPMDFAVPPGVPPPPPPPLS